MENVPKLKVETLTGQPRVLGLIIVKQSSVDMEKLVIGLLVNPAFVGQYGSAALT